MLPATFARSLVVKSAVRTLEILEHVARSGGRSQHSEIALALEIPVSSLTALLRDMVEMRYLRFDTATRQYSLGPQVLTLSSAYLSNLDLIQVADPVLRVLFQTVNEFTSLVIAKGTEVIKVREYAIADPLASHLQLGESGPMHATAGGKAILAFTPQPQRDELLERLDLRVFTRSTIATRVALEDELVAIRARGIAYCREEYLEGMVSIAAPVFDASQGVVGAIGVNTRAVRFSPLYEQTASAALQIACAQLSERLGGRLPAPVAQDNAPAKATRQRG